MCNIKDIEDLDEDVEELEEEELRLADIAAGRETPALKIDPIEVSYVNRPGVYSRRAREVWHDIVLEHFLGLSNKDIAEKHEMSETSVCIILGRPEVREAVARLRKYQADKLVSIQDEFRSALIDNLGVARELLQDDVSPEVRRKTFFSLADRVGAGPIKTIRHEDNSRLTSDDIEEIERRVKEKRMRMEAEEIPCQTV